MEPLTRPLTHILCCLAEVGGSANLDKFGRLIAGPERTVLQGDAVSYMTLVAHGLVAGEGGKIILTEAGREAVATHQAGRIRVAS